MGEADGFAAGKNRGRRKDIRPGEVRGRPGEVRDITVLGQTLVEVVGAGIFIS